MDVKSVNIFIESVVVFHINYKRIYIYMKFNRVFFLVSILPDKTRKKLLVIKETMKVDNCLGVQR